MAFVDNEMAVVGDEVVRLSAAHQALNQRDIDYSRRFPPPAADDANVLRIDVQERFQTLYPLQKQFPAMNQDKGIPRPVGD